jgi:hypothetical protein
MEAHLKKLSREVERVVALAEELKMLSLNLTVANAKLRVRDSAFHTVNASMSEMLDLASFAHDEAAFAIKKARGCKLDGSELERMPLDLDAVLDKISTLAEYIIRTVITMKRGPGVDQKL